MSIAYVIDEIFEAHVPPRDHPERPARLAHLRSVLRNSELPARGQTVPIRDVADDELGRVHTSGYLADLERIMPGASGWLDPDTYFCADSWRAARIAAAAAVDVTAAVIDDRTTRGLALVRPPGHHAEADRAMGFCLFNNVAVAAASARASGVGRVAILDFDVHHGNGTQHIFEADPNVLFMSVHQFPYYPGTGAPSEVGRGPGLGTTINVGLPSGCGDADYLAVLDQVFAPAIEAFGPDILIASAGYDAAAADPLAQMEVSPAGYRAIADSLCRIAEASAEGRLVAILEGGYDLDGLAGGVCAMVEAMLAETIGELTDSDANRVARLDPSPAAAAAIRETLAAHAAIVRSA